MTAPACAGYVARCDMTVELKPPGPQAEARGRFLDGTVPRQPENADGREAAGVFRNAGTGRLIPHRGAKEENPLGLCITRTRP